MGKLIYLMNVSLDGYTEAPDHSLDWSTVDDEIMSWFSERTRESAVAIYGRRMYETMTAYWPTGGSNPDSTPVMREYAASWNALAKVVFSRTLESADYGFRLRTGDVAEELAKLRKEFDGNIEVSGPNMASQFVERGLVDMYRAVVHPVILGAGTPYLPKLGTRITLRQTDIERFESGVVALTYVAA